MRTRRERCYSALALIVASSWSLAIAVGGEPKNVHWPGFRGHRGQGIAEGYATPTNWNVEASEGVKWKTAIPGLGHSSPAIWGDRLFVTTAISGKEDVELRVGLYGDIVPVEDDTVHRFRVYCLDKNTGEILWKRTCRKTVPKIKRHTKASHANCTPATDGKHVVVFFCTEGLFCYDMEGQRKWRKKLGRLDSGYYLVPKAQWGFGSSPIIHDGVVYVQCDVQKNSFVAAFNIEDGHELWRTPRDEVPTWGTPTIHSHGDTLQLIVNGYKHIGGYDARTGKELWRLRGGGDIPVPTPVVANGLAFITNAHGPKYPMFAIRLEARGDISLEDGATSNEFVTWSEPRNGAYMQTPLVYGEYLYSCRDSGVLTCYQARTGERVYRQRLGGGRTGFTASPVAANGRIYFTSEDGDVYIVQAGPEFKVLARNQMGEVCMATPAISEGTMFFRTQHHLVAIAGRPVD